MVSCFASADLVRHLSHWEGLPRAIMESMEFGLPAVASDISGCNELILDGTNGSLLNFGDIA
ncbi:MAG: glycosyltransferase, partial [Chloroflexi bacterium]|nr:glycosyltransferase [Chloroflexota bacterium]